MKKAFVILLLTLCLTACGKNDKNTNDMVNSTSSPAPTQQQTPAADPDNVDNADGVMDDAADAVDDAAGTVTDVIDDTSNGVNNVVDDVTDGVDHAVDDVTGKN